MYISEIEDFALLRVAVPAEGKVLLVSMQTHLPSESTSVALVSHPAFDTRRDAADLRRAFAGIYEVKRVGIGSFFGNEGSHLSYGLFSSGGSTGGPVVDLKTGRVFAMHIAGRAGEGGFGLSLAQILRDKVAREIIGTQPIK